MERDTARHAAVRDSLVSLRELPDGERGCRAAGTCAHHQSRFAATNELFDGALILPGPETAVHLLYDGARFTDESARQTLAHWRNDPYCHGGWAAWDRIRELPMLSAAEREQLVSGCDQTAAVFPGRDFLRICSKSKPPWRPSASQRV